MFLATAHPAKFHEIVELIMGRAIDRPAALAEALARPSTSSEWTRRSTR